MQVLEAFDKSLERAERKTRAKRVAFTENSTTWKKEQLAVNPDGDEFQITKVTAKRANVRQLKPREPGTTASDHMLDQLLFDFRSVKGVTQTTVTRIDDDFLWGSKTGYLQRRKDVLKPWPPLKKKGRKRPLE